MPAPLAAAPFLARTLVLVPALEEEECVAATVRDWLALGARRVRVVDNGSRDATAARAAEAGAEVVHEPVPGYGAAAWTGLQDWPADCDWILFSSADGSDRLTAEEAQHWQRAIDGGAEMVLGDRTADPEARACLKLVQRLGNWLCCTAIAWGWGRRFRDMASLRLVRRGALERLRLKDRGFGWNVEMQVRALEAGLQVAELPVEYAERRAGRSKISGSLAGTARAGAGILRMLGQLLRMRAGRETRVAHARPAESR
jgi:hypothetical protein